MLGTKVLKYHLVRFPATEADVMNSAIGVWLDRDYQPWGTPLACGEWIVQAMILRAEPEPKIEADPLPDPIRKKPRKGRPPKWTS